MKNTNMDYKIVIKRILLEYKSDLLNLEESVDLIDNLGIIDNENNEFVNITKEYYSKMDLLDFRKHILIRLINSLDENQLEHLINKIIVLTKMDNNFNQTVDLLINFK